MSELQHPAQMRGDVVALMNTKEAFAAVALAAVACDGSLGRDEAHALRRQLEYRSLYQDCSEAFMGDLFDRLLGLMREQGIDGLIDEALPKLSTHQKESALAVAAHLVHADRQVLDEESAFLTRLGASMMLPDGQAPMIVRASEALNRDSLDD